jgi:hypothetical protein
MNNLDSWCLKNEKFSDKITQGRINEKKYCLIKIETTTISNINDNINDAKGNLPMINLLAAVMEFRWLLSKSDFFFHRITVLCCIFFSLFYLRTYVHVMYTSISLFI